jgi:hypothetical protein
MLSTRLAQAWQVTTVKPIAELALMTEEELANEARHACMDMTVGNTMRKQFGSFGMDKWAPEWQRAYNYLQTIRLVVRKQHGGNIPVWFITMQEASLTLDSKPCVDVSQRVYEEAEEARLKPNRKSDAELAAMSERTLVLEAWIVCQQSSHTIAVRKNPQKLLAEFKAYLATIGNIAAKQHHGSTPRWSEEFQEAAQQTDHGARCNEVYERALAQRD